MLEIINEINKLVDIKIGSAPYFNEFNFQQNQPTLKYEVNSAILNEFGDEVYSKYDPLNNTISARADGLKLIYLLKVYLEMLMTDRNNLGAWVNEINFAKGLNRAAIEWLTLKILDLELKLENTEYYEVVKMFDFLTKIYTEDKMFKNLFSGTYKTFINSFNQNERKQVEGYISLINGKITDSNLTTGRKLIR